MMSYYVKDNGKLYGPISSSKLSEACRKGFFSYGALMSYDRIQWISVTEFLNQENGSSVGFVPPPQPVFFTDSKKDIQIKRNVPAAVVQENTVSRDNPGPRDNAAVKNKKSKLGNILYSCMLFLLLVSGVYAGYWWFYIRCNEEKLLNSVVQSSRHALGKVFVYLEQKNGVSLRSATGLNTNGEIAVGNAFAIAPDLYVANGSKIHSLHEMAPQAVENIMFEIIKDAAQNAGYSSMEQFRQFCSANVSSINKLRAAFKNGVKVREIRIKKYDSAFVSVSKVQLHPLYSENKDKNADLALLTIDTSAGLARSVFFTASADKMSNLRTGVEIGCPKISFSISGVAVNLLRGHIERVVASDIGISEISCDVPVNVNDNGSPVLLADGSVIAVTAPERGSGASIKTISISLLDGVKNAPAFEVGRY